jgi:acyl-CoA thioester hydrolase
MSENAVVGSKFAIFQNVRVADLNYGAHLGYTQMIQLIHNSRVSLLSSLGLNELDCFGYWIIMSNTQTDYKAECFLGDKLKFEVEAQVIDGLRICFNTTVTHEDNRIAAIAKDTMLFFDTNKRKPVRVPAEFKALIS